MKKKKTIKGLLSDARAVYVKLSTQEVADVFFALARYEGFVLTNEVAKIGAYKNYFVRLNNDMSISYPAYRTWGGAMKFHHSKMENGKRVEKIDFEKMI